MGVLKKILSAVLIYNILFVPLFVYSDTNTVSTNTANVMIKDNKSGSGSLSTLEDKQTLAVIGFINMGDKPDKDINLVISKSMIIFLSKVPGVKIIEFDDVEKHAKQNNFWESKKLDINTALDMGLLMKAKHIIVGDYKVNKQKDTILINVYVYDVTTGDLILKKKVRR